MERELKKVDEKKIVDVLDAYFSWKKSSELIKNLNGRASNFSEAISERLVCYINNFSLATEEGSYDAISIDGKTIQIKATSKFNDDLSSFGPRSQFDYLHFARFDINKDEVWLYNINKGSLDEVIINKEKNETFLEQQKQGRRPRLSIIKEFVNKYQLEPYKKVNLHELYKFCHEKTKNS